jgi:hypothetical protein
MIRFQDSKIPDFTAYLFSWSVNYMCFLTVNRKGNKLIVNPNHKLEQVNTYLLRDYNLFMFKL